MLHNDMDQDLSNILFLDIETVAGKPSYQDLNERVQEHWNKKAGFIQREGDLTPDELYYQRAGIYAEFGKIVTIAVGFITEHGKQLQLRVKAFSDENEKALLTDFKTLLDKKFDPETLLLCAHNGKEFDFPYICRRMLINGISLPYVLDITGKKPWEVRHLDTMEMWKFGDRKNFTSLDLLATIFDIDTSKGDIDGSQVTPVYYEENDLERITEYCKRDVVVTAQLFLKFKTLPAIKPENVHIL